MTNWTAVAVGASLQIAIVLVGATVPMLEETGVTGVLFLLLIGLPGGYLTGVLADGGWRGRAWYGLVSGSIGGFVLGATLWYTMVTPGAPEGVLYELNYQIATIGIPADFAATYDTQIPIVLGIGCMILLALEGTIAGGAAPGQQTSTPNIH